MASDLRYQIHAAVVILDLMNVYKVVRERPELPKELLDPRPNLIPAVINTILGVENRTVGVEWGHIAVIQTFGGDCIGILPVEGLGWCLGPKGIGLSARDDRCQARQDRKRRINLPERESDVKTDPRWDMRAFLHSPEDTTAIALSTEGPLARENTVTATN
jgi:hypothetical protein